MSRQRMIKPEFWSDESVNECSVSARLLFIATWNFADDEGNLCRSAKQLKAQTFPYDLFDCEPLIVELITHGLLTEYSVSDKKFLHIPNFKKHQIINRPSKPQCPLYEHSLSTHPEVKEVKEVKEVSMSGKPDSPAPKTPKPKNNGAETTEVIFYLNKKAGTNFKLVEANTRLIAARLKDGATIEDCKRVVDLKVSEWGRDSKMREYLRPATLFNAEKFAQYAGQVAAQPAERPFVC